VQVAPHKKGQQPGGISAAARELGIEETYAKRAVKTDSLSPEAKATARKVGLDDNRSALLEAACETNPAKQVESLTKRAARKLTGSEKVEKQYAELIKVWGRTGAEARQKFLAIVAPTRADGSTKLIG
jgi:hypothetical protein